MTFLCLSNALPTALLATIGAYVLFSTDDLTLVSSAGLQAVLLFRTALL